MLNVVIQGGRSTASCDASSDWWPCFLQGGAAAGALAAGTMAILAYALKIITEALISKWQRERRRLEILRALRSELRDSVKNYKGTYLRPDLPDTSPIKPRRIMSDRFTNALLTGVPYIPFATFIPSDMLWDVIRPELSALDGNLLDDIASYYYTDRLLGQIFANFRSADYKDLSIDRQQSAALEIFPLVAELIFTGRKIVKKIDSYEKSFWRQAKSIFFFVTLIVVLSAVTLSVV